MLLIEVIPNLWLGDQEITKHISKLTINCVINCSKDLHFLGNYEEYVVSIKNNIEKYEIVKMYEYLNETVDFIYKNLKADKSILVFCESGNQKSPTVIAAYLIKYGKMSKNDAIKSIRTKHESAFYPDINFDISLEMFQNNFM